MSTDTQDGYKKDAEKYKKQVKKYKKIMQSKSCYNTLLSYTGTGFVSTNPFYQCLCKLIRGHYE